MFAEMEREELIRDSNNLTDVQREIRNKNGLIFEYKLRILIQDFKTEYTRLHCNTDKDVLLNKFKILDELMNSIN
jgi:hypothetical protein